MLTEEKIKEQAALFDEELERLRTEEGLSNIRVSIKKRPGISVTSVKAALYRLDNAPPGIMPPKRPKTIIG